MDLQGKTVLVVDDEEALREIMAEELSLKNANALCAENGTTALELLKSNKFEVSPFTDIGALYDNGVGESRRLKSVLYLDSYSKAGKSRAHGYIGYDKSGNSIRDFGDIECSKKQDMQTTIR